MKDLKRKRRKKAAILVCEYVRDKHNWVTSCGMRTKYEKYWNLCPYCGKPIIWLGLDERENEIK